MSVVESGAVDGIGLAENETMKKHGMKRLRAGIL